MRRLETWTALAIAGGAPALTLVAAHRACQAPSARSRSSPAARAASASSSRASWGGAACAWSSVHATRRSSSARARASRARGIDVTALPCDVTDEDGIQGLVADVEQNLGPIDVLVNNAGIIQVGPVETMKPDDYRRAMDVMFWGALNRPRRCCPGCGSAGAGRS